MLTSIIRTLIGLTAEPATVTADQTWHLDEAAAFVQALGVMEQPMYALVDSERRTHDTTFGLVRAAMAASGLPAEIVAAELLSLETERSERPDWGLLGVASDRWSAPQIPARSEDERSLLNALASGNEWLVHVTQVMCTDAAELPTSFRNKLLTILVELNGIARRAAAIILAYHWPINLPPLNDPIVRGGVAAVQATRLAKAGRHLDVAPLLTDTDLSVRHEAAIRLEPVPAEARAVLETALAQPADQWTCIWCDMTMAPSDQACPRSHARPDTKLA